MRRCPLAMPLGLPLVVVVALGCAERGRAGPDAGADASLGDGPEPRTDSGPGPDAFDAAAPDGGTQGADMSDASLSDAARSDGGEDDGGADDAGPADMGAADMGAADTGPCVAPPDAVCDPVRQTGCLDGEACIVTDASGGVSCRSTFGSRGFGVACSAGNECVPRAACVIPSGGGILQCRQLCETTRSPTCTNIRNFPSCLGVFFPRTITGGTYFGP